MKQIVEALTAVLFIMLASFAGIAVVTASSSILAAKEYKADVIAEIENSDFNTGVVRQCFLQGQMPDTRWKLHHVLMMRTTTCAQQKLL